MGTPQRGRIRSRTNYVERGFSEHDGLGPGEWVVRPNSAGVLDWRPIEEGDDE